MSTPESDRVRLECDGRIVVRTPVAADATSLTKHANDHKIWVNLRDVMPHPYALDDATRWIEGVRDQRPRRSFAIDVGGEAVGSIGLVPGVDIERYSAEVGYWLGTAYWGQGIATAAVRRVVRYAFEELRMTRVFATPMVWNPASCRVLQKAGFEQEGIMRNAFVKDGKIVDAVLYAIVKDGVN